MNLIEKIRKHLEDQGLNVITDDEFRQVVDRRPFAKIGEEFADVPVITYLRSEEGMPLTDLASGYSFLRDSIATAIKIRLSRALLPEATGVTPMGVASCFAETVKSYGAVVKMPVRSVLPVIHGGALCGFNAFFLAVVDPPILRFSEKFRLKLLEHGYDI